jgi:GTP-binding protein
VATPSGSSPEEPAAVSTPVVAIVGAPNVGKSTLFNRMVGRRRSIVTDEPGVTRDRVYGEVADADPAFRLVDTGGLAMRLDAPFNAGIEAQVLAALDEASAVLFVVDTRAGVTALDREIVALLRRRARPVVLVANKVDGPAIEAELGELYTLGLGEPLGISAEHGLGMNELLERLARILEGLERSPVRGDETRAVRIALVGRPNVGKSSLLNRLLGEDRVMVSEVPGTTRDVVDTMVERDGRHYRLLDTAGLRRKGRVSVTAEVLSGVVARNSIRRADVVVLVLDGSETFAAQDAHIAGYAHEAARPLVVVVNKWDLVDDREAAAKRWQETIETRLAFTRDAPVVFVSARTGQRVDKMLEHADELHAAAGRRVSTPELNRWLDEVARAEHDSPARGRSVHLLYATQVGVRPPSFVLFCNHPGRIHFSLRRFLQNSLRERFSFGAVPIRLRFRKRSTRERA